MSDSNDSQRNLTITIGREQLVIRRRYEMVSIVNDFFIAIWFLIGSICFLFPELQQVAAWLFVIGSFQFIVRPSIRLIRHIHLQSLPESGWES